MGQYDDTLRQLADRYGISDDDVEALGKASPLRSELDDERKKRKEAESRAGNFRSAALQAQFAKHDLKLNPKALNLPEDLDVLDEQAVADWLVEAGAIQAAPAVSDEEHDRISRIAGAGSQSQQSSQTPGVLTVDVAAGWPADKWSRFAKEHPEAAEALRRGEEVQGIVF